MAFNGFFAGGVAQGLESGARVGMGAIGLGLEARRVRNEESAFQRQIQQDVSAARQQRIESRREQMNTLKNSITVWGPDDPRTKTAQENLVKIGIAQDIDLQAEGMEPEGILFASKMEQEVAQKAMEAEAAFNAVPTEARADRERAMSQASAEGAAAGGPQTKGETVSGRDAAGNIVTFNVQRDLEGNVVGMQKLASGPQAGTTTLETRVTPNKESDIQREAGSTAQVIDLAKRIRGLPDTEKGFVGSAKRTARGAAELAGDVVTVFGEQLGADLKSVAEGIRDEALQNIDQIEDPEFRDQVAFGDIAEVPVVESLLAYAVARALRPDGRLDARTIETAKERTKLTGFTSAEAVNQRLDTLIRFLEQRQKIIESSTTPGAQPQEGMPTFRFNPATNSLEPVQ